MRARRHRSRRADGRLIRLRDLTLGRSLRLSWCRCSTGDSDMSPILLVPLALAFGLAAGGSHGQPPVAGAADSTVVATDTMPARAKAPAPAVIQFDNQAWDLATVYLVPQSGGLPVRL